jgi:hypothetical protein
VVLPIYFLISDIRGDVRSAKRGTEAVAQGGGVAVGELQAIAEQVQTWAADYDGWRAAVDEIDEKHTTEIQELKDRITFLEGYLKGRHRTFDPEDRPKSEKPKPTGRKPPPRMGISRPQAPLIDSVKDAQQYQKARKELKCAKDDPDCGADAIDLE